MRPNALALTLCSLAALGLLDLGRLLPGDPGLSLVNPAYADDHDGGGDDGGDDDGGDDDDGGNSVRGDRSGQGAEPRRKRIKTKRRAAPVAVSQALPVRAPGEIVVSGLSEPDLTALLGQGFAVIEAVSITRSGPVLHRLKVPAGQSLDAARSNVRVLDTGRNADFNHYFRPNQDITPAAAPSADRITALCTHLNCGALDQIGWPTERAADCQATIGIGVIDTSLNLDHAGFAAAQIDLVRLSDVDLPASGESHGTAVVGMLVGAEARAPGLLPEAKITAVDIFSRNGSDERADVVHLVQALDLLSTRQLRLVNLSLSGPENAVLTDMLAAVAQSGMLVVAAAGNGGAAAPPAWPAAADTVLAVTAMDSRDRIYRQAQRGPHVDLAAPGVEVWSAASSKGVKPRSGTSYAAPFATAAAALLMSRDPGLTPAATVAQLRAMTRDLGAVGPDDIFGAGALLLSGICQTTGP